MKSTRLALVLGALVCAAVLLVLCRPGKLAERDRPSVGPSGSPTEVAALPGSGAVATSPVSGPVDQVGPAQVSSRPTLGEPHVEPRELPDAVEKLLSRPRDFWPLMSEVPVLENEESVELARRVGGTTNLMEKYRLLCVLAYGGSDLGVPMITNLLTKDLGGRELTNQEWAVYLHLPSILGIVARHDHGALEFLIRGTELGFWEAAGVPNWYGAPTEPFRLRSACVKGLAYVQQPEAQAVLADFRDHPDRAWELGVDGGLVDAAFIDSTLRSEDLASALGSQLKSENSYNAFVHWYNTTPDGHDWGLWSESVRTNHLGMERPTFPPQR